MESNLDAPSRSPVGAQLMAAAQKKEAIQKAPDAGCIKMRRLKLG
jgi:hypothetical protein